MANQIQQLLYEGHVSSEPELRYTGTGRPVANFQMASNQSYKNSEGEEVKTTTWLRVTVWGPSAENYVSKFLHKGDHVIVMGRLSPGKDGNPNVFELKNGGHGASYEVTATNIRILNSKQRSEDSSDNELSEDPNNIPF